MQAKNSLLVLSRLLENPFVYCDPVPLGPLPLHIRQDLPSLLSHCVPACV